MHTRQLLAPLAAAILLAGCSSEPEEDPADQWRLPLSPGAKTLILDRWPGPEPMIPSEADTWARYICTEMSNGVPYETIAEEVPLSREKELMKIYSKPQHEEFFVATVMHEACPELVPAP